MSEIHLLKDETLGGVLREFVEVDRKAEVGDFIIFKFESLFFRPTRPYKVVNIGSNNDIVIGDIEGDTHILEQKYYHLVEPTNIVIIDEDGNGKRYRIVERKAKVGEKIILVNPAFDYHEDAKIGNVYEVIRIEHDACNRCEVIALKDTVFRMYHSEYNVLEPVEATPEVTDLLANLARRVISLESQLADTQRNVERQAQELENKAREINAKIEMRIDDVIQLVDERAQPSAIDNAMKAIEYIAKAYGGGR